MLAKLYDLRQFCDVGFLLNNTIIQLDQIKIAVSTDTDPLPKPNAFNLLCSIADELICADSIGGVTLPPIACSIVSLIPVQQLPKFARDLAEQEQAANLKFYFLISLISQKTRWITSAVGQKITLYNSISLIMTLLITLNIR